MDELQTSVERNHSDNVRGADRDSHVGAVADEFSQFPADGRHEKVVLDPAILVYSLFLRRLVCPKRVSSSGRIFQRTSQGHSSENSLPFPYRGSSSASL